MTAGENAPIDGEATKRRSLTEMERTGHKRCGDCWRYVARERWTTPLAEQCKDSNARITNPLCQRCYAEHDPPEW